MVSATSKMGSAAWCLIALFGIACAAPPVQDQNADRDWRGHPWAKWEAGSKAVASFVRKKEDGVEKGEREEVLVSVEKDRAVISGNVFDNGVVVRQYQRTLRLGQESVRYQASQEQVGEETLRLGDQAFPCKILKGRTETSPSEFVEITDWVHPQIAIPMKRIEKDSKTGMVLGHSRILSIDSEVIRVQGVDLNCQKISEYREGDPWIESSTLWRSPLVPGGSVKSESHRRTLKGNSPESLHFQLIAFEGKPSK